MVKKDSIGMLASKGRLKKHTINTPSDIVGAPLLEVFKMRLDGALSNLIH